MLVLEIAIVFTALLFTKKFFGKTGLIGWVAIATILANLLTAKNVGICGLSVSVGTVWFASTFLATDILSECYGKGSAQKAVYFGVFANLLFIIAPQITLAYIPSAVDYADGFMRGLFTLNLRISISSSVMYLLANLADVYIYNRFRERMQGRYMWLRNNVSTALTNCLENFGFFALAFWGVYDGKTIIIIALSTSIVESIVALCDTPFLYIATGRWHDKAEMEKSHQKTMLGSRDI